MNLQENIQRIKEVMGMEENMSSLNELDVNVKRRFSVLKKLVDVILSNTYPCDFLNEEHYFEGVLYDLETFLITFNMEGMTNEQIQSFVKDYFHKEINQYYIDSQEDC